MPRSPSSPQGPKLTVARDGEGRRISISTLTFQKQQHLPLTPVYCLTCSRPLIARLGTQRRHHFAHHPDPDASRCWATAPEGPLHLAAKAHLATLLEQACSTAQMVVAAMPCPRCHTAEAVRIDVVQLHPEDRVLVEHWTDPRRTLKPDLQVLSPSGQPLLLLEVRVTHANSDAKLQLLRASPTPMLELDGERAAELDPSIPILPTLTALNLRAVDPCPACVAEQRHQDARRAERDAERASHRALIAHIRAVLPQATTETRLALHRMARTHLVAAAHVDFYRRRSLQERRPLVVHATWQAELVTLELSERSGPTIRTWTGTPAEIATIFGDDLLAAIHDFATALAPRLGPDTHFQIHDDFPEQRYVVPDTFTAPPLHLEALWWPVFRKKLEGLLPPSPDLDQRLDRLRFHLSFTPGPGS